jgi:hypothetical protein
MWDATMTTTLSLGIGRVARWLIERKIAPRVNADLAKPA